MVMGLRGKRMGEVRFGNDDVFFFHPFSDSGPEVVVGDFGLDGIAFVFGKLVDELGAAVDGEFGDVEGVDEFSEDLVHLDAGEGSVADLKDSVSTRGSLNAIIKYLHVVTMEFNSLVPGDAVCESARVEVAL